MSKAWAHAKFVKGGKGDRQFGSRAHDYAVLTTKLHVPAERDPAHVGDRRPATARSRAGKRVRTAGYPADPRYAGMNGLNMWRTEGKVRPAGREPRHLPFTGFVAAGMSGGPVWRTYSQDSPCGRTQCVVGIVTECAINAKGLCRKGNGSDRLAVRITPQVKQLIKQK